MQHLPTAAHGIMPGVKLACQPMTYDLESCHFVTGDVRNRLPVPTPLDQLAFAAHKSQVSLGDLKQALEASGQAKSARGQSAAVGWG